MARPSRCRHLTWAEQEVVDALKRLARAQSHLADLDARAGEATTPTFEAADVERLEHLQGQLTQARAKAAGRFGRAAARARLDELEMAERLVLDRMGVASYADYRSVIEAPHVDAVDPQVLAFAQRELASARTAWLEVQALEIPPVEEPEPAPRARGHHRPHRLGPHHGRRRRLTRSTRVRADPDPDRGSDSPTCTSPARRPG